MNEMLRGLGFGQVSSTKWTSGESMIIVFNATNLSLTCYGDINYKKSEYESRVRYTIKATDPETTKHHVEKFMRMVGKCIQVGEE